MAAAALASAPAPAPLPAAFAGWWEHVNGSPAWQDGTFWALAALYGLIAASSFVLVWVLLWLNPNPSMLVLSKLFIAGLSFSAALGFLLYGGRLFLMLKRFPIESKGRQQKLSEVGRVAAICSCCFLARCVMMCFAAFDKEADLDVLDHPILNFIYYLLVEIVPSALVLYILRRIPSKLKLAHYHPLSSG